ncbi:hypothetical protein [Terriglobus tenax]|uniref:hypothetical protein n=1 Tax=Terriglobus tenax TaxID=1111115 RepID=UPI0021E0C355|nr:hypothetical protein [Terriglobus tenax]
MHRYENYWIVTLFRGVLATMFGCAIVLIPQMSSSLLLLPFATVLSILFLAVYGAADSALVFVGSFALPERPGQIASRLQGVLGVVIALLLATIAFEQTRVHWFFYLVAAQAGAAAVSDMVTARHVWRHHRTMLVYASALVAGTAAVYFLMSAILVAPTMPAEISARVLYGYLLGFGVVNCGLACLMLQDKSHHHGVGGAVLPHAR